jgi:hypothetical protein
MGYIRWFVIIGFLADASTCLCQDIISISGKVLDSEKKFPLAHASVGIKGKYIGTITNDRGEFEIHVPKDFSQDTLYVSMLGYWNFSLNINKINPHNMVHIYLDVHPTLLQEVIVSPGLTPQEKLKQSFENISKNYPTDLFLMKSFYRETKKLNERYVSLIEAAVDIYDKNGYKNARIKKSHRLEEIDERGIVRQMRKSYNFLNKKLEGQIGLHNNLLAYLLIQNPIKYPTKVSGTVALQENTVFLNDKIVYEITGQLNGIDTKYYLDSDSYAVLEYTEARKGNYLERKISDSVSLKYHDLFKTVKFRSIKGILYPERFTLSWKIEKYNFVSRKTILTLEIGLQLLVNEIEIQNLKIPSSKEKMEIYSLEWQVGKYNAEFWNRYNAIKETPLHKKILEDLEKELSLEEQFMKLNNR